jgi:uncharacterized delta-60 repeat protein
MLAGGAASVRAQSALDGFDPNANGLIRAIVVQPDGKIIIGGDFTTLTPNGGSTVTRNRIARLNPDGTLDTAFNPNADGSVRTIALQADGKILVGGRFAAIGGQTRNFIARLEPVTGSADSFNPNATGGFFEGIGTITLQSDGKILAGGDFTNIGGQGRQSIARLDPATGLADSFNPNPNGSVFAILVQADGKIVVGGTFTLMGGQTRSRIARLDTATGLADSFNPNANNPVRSFAVQADGKLLVGGAFTNIGGQTRNRIARLDASTGLADSFDANANGEVDSLAVQPNGKIIVGGRFSFIGGATRNKLARTDANVGFADSFDPNVNSSALPIFSIVVQSDGKVLVGGGFTALAPSDGAAVTRNHIARLETDGRLDRTLDLSLGGITVAVVALQPDGKILIGGNFTSVLGVARNCIARLNPDGTLDAAFDPNASSSVFSIAVQADGKILVGGVFANIGGVTRNRIARLNPDGTLDPAFNPNASGAVYSIAVQADGKILAVGDFASIGGEARNRIARLNANGFADSFNPNANGGVYDFAVQADGKILVVGNFTSIGGEARNRIARLDATTGAVDSFNPNANSTVYCIAVQPDGKILVGGLFNSGSGPNTIGGATREYIARLDPASGLADSFNPNASHQVNVITVQADGKILVGGQFGSIGGQPRNRIARLEPVSGSADSFNPNANHYVTSIALQPDGKILAVGNFTFIGGAAREKFARLRNDTAARQTLAVTQTTTAWTRGGASPQFARVTFELSTDNVNYTLLGPGTASGSNWTLTGLNLPLLQNIYIRARGYYRGTASAESIAESVRNAFITTADPTPTPTPTPVPVTTLANISTRLRVETGDNVLIGGFIVTGTQPKKVIIRAIGTSLPFSDKLENPTLELHGPNGLIEANDDWVNSPNYQAILDSTIPPSNNLESAIVAMLPANNAGYTAIVRGANGGTGIGVVEAYDLDIAADSKLANISTRGLVQTGDNVLIAGTIVVGQAPQRVIIRAIGPSLPIAGKMENPALELRDANGGLMQANDNWVDSADKQAIIDTTIPPSHDLESAIIALLPANNASYTAIVRGVNDTTGIAVVEVYALD